MPMLCFPVVTGDDSRLEEEELSLSVMTFYALFSGCERL
jgi:hypothetical protein